MYVPHLPQLPINTHDDVQNRHQLNPLVPCCCSLPVSAATAVHSSRPAERAAVRTCLLSLSFPCNNHHFPNHAPPSLLFELPFLVSTDDLPQLRVCRPTATSSIRRRCVFYAPNREGSSSVRPNFRLAAQTSTAY